MFLVKMELTSIKGKETFYQYFTISRKISDEQIIKVIYDDRVTMDFESYILNNKYRINVARVDKVHGNDVHYLNRYGVIEGSKIC